MRKYQGFPQSMFAFVLISVACTGCGVLLGMLMTSEFNAGRWRALPPTANNNLTNSTHQLYPGYQGSPKSPKHTLRPRPSELPGSPKISWVPSDNIPYHLRYQENSKNLVQVDQFYDVKVLLNQDAADAFRHMQGAASNDGIYLQAVSGYRSYQDQEELFNTQIAKHGSRLEASRLSAPPGYSEHHTGYALDIGDMKNQKDVLTISFEQGKAFRWLQLNASAYGFELSFPRKNIMNVSYEPWHWRFVGTDTAKEVFREARGMAQPSQSLSRSAPYQR